MNDLQLNGNCRFIGPYNHARAFVGTRGEGFEYGYASAAANQIANRYRLEPCVRLIEHQPNGFHSKISFGSTVSAAKRAMNIAAPVSTP